MNKYNEETLKAYDIEIDKCRELMKAKNADYGDAWAIMRPESITDQILNKILRVRELEEKQRKGEQPKVSEGIVSEFMDILNYSAFQLIKLNGNRQVSESIESWQALCSVLSLNFNGG